MCAFLTTAFLLLFRLVHNREMSRAKILSSSGVETAREEAKKAAAAWQGKAAGACSHEPRGGIPVNLTNQVSPFGPVGGGAPISAYPRLESPIHLQYIANGVPLPGAVQ